MKENFNGNLKDAIISMLQNNTDCCEITHTVGDVAVTVELTIKKIVDGDNVVYDAEEAEAEVEFRLADSEETAGYLS